MSKGISSIKGYHGGGGVTHTHGKKKSKTKKSSKPKAPPGQPVSKKHEFQGKRLSKPPKKKTKKIKKAKPQSEKLLNEFIFKLLPMEQMLYHKVAGNSGTKIYQFIKWKRGMMKENDWMSYMAGYQDFAERTRDEKVFEYVRLLNTQLARTLYSTVPKMVNGTGLTTLIGSELGLYGSSNLARQHKDLFKKARKLSPKFADDYLTPLEERKRIARAYKSILPGGSPKSDYDPNDLRAILTALERMKNQG